MERKPKHFEQEDLFLGFGDIQSEHGSSLGWASFLGRGELLSEV
jgi:hypothetical protein